VQARLPCEGDPERHRIDPLGAVMAKPGQYRLGIRASSSTSTVISICKLIRAAP